MKRMLIFGALSLTSFCSYGQTIEHETNAPRTGDKYTVRQLEYFAPGDEGKDVLWDFSDLQQTGIKSRREYFWSVDSVQSVINEKGMFRYALTKDSLLCRGYDTHLRHMTYSEPLIILTYPFCYGDSISNHFSGTGDYCKKLILKNSGTLVVEADAEGTIVAVDDTLRNVLRIHTILLNSVSMHIPSDTLLADTSRMKQEIEENYYWYVRGYRYPMFETSCVSYYDNMTPLSFTQTAYRYFPEEYSIENDSVNDKRRYDYSRAKMSKPDVIHYHVQNDGSRLTIHYTLDAEASINALISSSRGILYERQSAHSPKGDGYQMNFPISSLPKGDYILYINVNGKVYNEKFNVK